MGPSAHFPPSSSPRPSSLSSSSLHPSRRFTPGVVDSIRFVVVVVGLSSLSWLCGLPTSSSFSTFSVSFTSSSSCRLSSACRFLLLRARPPPLHLPSSSSCSSSHAVVAAADVVDAAVITAAAPFLLPPPSSLLFRILVAVVEPILAIVECFSPLSNLCAVVEPSFLCRNWSSECRSVVTVLGCHLVLVGALETSVGGAWKDG